MTVRAPFGDGAGAGLVGRNLARGEVPLPVMILRNSALEHNLDVMQDFCVRHNVLHAPHGKTHMCPEIMRRQLARGAWGLTAATVQQAGVMLAAGAPRVLIANEVVGRANISWLSHLMAEYRGTEILCLVDSIAAVRALEVGLSATEGIGVLLEVGYGGRRAGVRNRFEALEVVSAIGGASGLQLRGLETYEGAVASDRSARSLRLVDDMLSQLAELAVEIEAGPHWQAPTKFIVSAGGSALPDRVVTQVDLPRDRFDIVLRSGAYVSHDDGWYADRSPLPLRPALELWAEVLSVPEEAAAIIGFGKREAPYDLGLPILKRLVDCEVTSGLSERGFITDTNDHHAFMTVKDIPLTPGMTLVFGISHPCSAFDKWATVILVDDNDTVIDVVPTYF